MAVFSGPENAERSGMLTAAIPAAAVFRKERRDVFIDGMFNGIYQTVRLNNKCRTGMGAFFHSEMIVFRDSQVSRFSRHALRGLPR
jgi:hypothetical protein